MLKQNIIILLEFIFCLIVYGLIDYFKQKVKHKAILEDISKITKKVETVKNNFNTKIEGLKSELQKQNIAYQINLSELTKIRFERIDSLYENLVNLQTYTKDNMFFYYDDDDYQSKKDNFKNLYDIAEMSRYKCNLYISQELKEKIIEVMNNAFSAYSAFIKLYNSDTKDFKGVSIFNLSTQALMTKLKNENMLALFDLDTSIRNFPKLLDQLEKEFKKQVMLKELD